MLFAFCFYFLNFAALEAHSAALSSALTEAHSRVRTLQSACAASALFQQQQQLKHGQELERLKNENANAAAAAAEAHEQEMKKAKMEAEADVATLTAQVRFSFPLISTCTPFLFFLCLDLRSNTMRTS